MHAQVRQIVCKVPEVTPGFWIIKILATTLGETGGDTLSMSMGLIAAAIALLPQRAAARAH